eukprot:g33721.t1
MALRATKAKLCTRLHGQMFHCACLSTFATRNAPKHEDQPPSPKMRTPKQLWLHRDRTIESCDADANRDSQAVLAKRLWLVFSDCEDDPVKNVRFVAASESNVFRFQLGRQCGHPEDGADASGEPRLAFPADCASTRHSFKYRKLSEDERLPGFVIQSVDNPIQYCIHPYGGNDRPPGEML